MAEGTGAYALPQPASLPLSPRHSTQGAGLLSPEEQALLKGSGGSMPVHS